MRSIRYQAAIAAMLWLSLAGLMAGCGGNDADHGADHAQHAMEGDAEAEPPKDSVPVEVGALARDDMSALYSTSATLRASRRATVTTRTQGVIERLLVEEGDRVVKDQVLARLENDEQEIALDRAQATLETRRGEYERLESLFGQELVSKDEFEKARREYRDAQHAADLTELELTRTEIRAPFDGVVVRRHLDVGNTVTSSTAVYDLADVTPLNADVNVPERHVARLGAGQLVRLVSDANDSAVEAEIERIAPAVDAATGTVKVTLAVEAADGLRPGTFVRVDIVTDTHTDALVTPRSALVAEGRRWFLFRVDETGQAVEKIEVELGYESLDLVEVIAVNDVAPLRGEDTVVVAGAGALEDGSPIEVMNVDSPTEAVADDSSSDDAPGDEQPAS